MKAIICKKYGPPEVLQWAEIEKPTPKPNEVLIKIHCSTVTKADIRIRAFDVPPSFWLMGRLALGITKPRQPILGGEMAGGVVAIGSKVTRFKPGDRVVAMTGHELGCYAEYRCIKEDGCISKIPENLSFQEAVAIPLGAATALNFFRKANIQQGQKMLVYGASGSVGVYAVQLAKHFGAEVTGVCSTTNLEMVRSLGADHVIDYTTTDFTKNSEKYDIIFDAVGKASIKGTIQSLKPNGTYIHAIVTPGTGIIIQSNLLFSKKKLVQGTFTGNSELITTLMELAQRGKLKPVIDRVYPMEEIVDAHRYVDTGRKKGNVVIVID
jgi:NADPH:quinone reductase-like Zn-dependent oxidoreductase